MARQLSVVLLPVFTALLMLSSILCLSFKATSVSTYSIETSGGTSNSGIFLTDFQMGPARQFNQYPDNLLPVISLSKPVFAAAGLGFAVSVLCTTICVLYMRRRKPVEFYPIWSAVFLTILGTNAILATATFILQFVHHGQSPHFNPDYRESGYYSYAGTFDLETWACEMPSYIERFSEPNFKMKTQCLGESASRYLIIFLWIASTAVLGCVLWDLRTNKAVVSHAKVGPGFDDESDGF